MKVVMINDCAYVGETLLKYLPSKVKRQHIKRSRTFLGKTIILLYKLLRAKGNIYHVNYLLQDAYLALKLRKRPILGHAHGTDLRTTLKHPRWGWLVKYNLMHSDKIVVSAPDILRIAREFREDAIYIPNPVDTGIFYPNSTEKLKEIKDGLRVLIASDSSWAVKGTDIVIKALSKLKHAVNVSIIEYGIDFERTLKLAEKLGLKINVLRRMPHEKIREYYWNADVVIDRLKLGSLGMVSLEAIASGRPAIAYVSSSFPEYNDFPLKDIRNEQEIIEVLENLDLYNLWKTEYNYLMNHHEPHKIIRKILKIYEELAENNKR